MKFLTTLLLAVLVGLVIYMLRRRIKLALTVAGITYMVVLPIRLLFSAGDIVDRFDTLVWPVLIVLVLWLGLRQASLIYERRKKGPV